MTDITPERLAEIKERVRFAFATAIGLMSAGSLRLADAYIQDVPDLIAALEAAQAENAKLRSDMAKVYELALEAAKEISGIKAELGRRIKP